MAPAAWHATAQPLTGAMPLERLRVR